MAAKPIIDVNHKGKRVVVEFSREQRDLAIRYNIVVDGRSILTSVFAEQVMRWLVAAMQDGS